MRKLFLILALLLGVEYCINYSVAQEVSVVITTDEGYSNPTLIKQMQSNLSAILTEVNAAQKENRLLRTAGLAMNEFAKRSLSMLWANIHFYCDDSEVVERCWVFGDGKEFMVSHIPLIIEVEGSQFGSGTYQEAVVEFDQQGIIKDFRFSLDAQLSESMENCGEVIEIERRMKILSYCERLRTAYNQKDIDFINQIFSDDALIITGTVITAKPVDGLYTDKLKVVYKKQNKEQYIANLKKAFLRNKWIEVKFSDIGENAELKGCAGVTRSQVNPNMYGVRLRQEWRSTNYSDTGYLFLLWDFTEENRPVIHVRTWQPDMVGGVKQQPDNNISTLGAFDL